MLLTSSGRLEVEVAIPEVLSAQVREGDEVTVKFDAIEDQRLGARVTEVGVISTGAAATFPVTVRMDKEDPDCRPGMAAEVGFRFGGGGGREHIYVPGVAVSEDRQGRSAYVVETDGEGVSKAVRRAVQIKGEIGDGGTMEIIEGLADGELVVTAGVSRIVDGQTVRLLSR
jgi:multidrug efflux system membrane fusion protein